MFKKKRKKYKKRNPLYFYYTIENYTYKYTCRNKYRKHILDFRCTDSNCPAQGYLNREKDEFKPNEFTSHINYEDHSYIVVILYLLLQKKNSNLINMLKKIFQELTQKKI